VQQKFDLDAHEFGTVFSFTALGSMFGALTFAVIQPTRPIRALLLGVPLVFVMLMIAPWLPTLSLTVTAMSLTGYGLYLTFASLTVSMQLDVDEAYRGRLSAVIGLGFSSIGPLMSFPWGHLADYIGAPQTITAAAVIFGVSSAVLALANRSDEVLREGA